MPPTRPSLKIILWWVFWYLCSPAVPIIILSIANGEWRGILTALPAGMLMTLLIPMVGVMGILLSGLDIFLVCGAILFHGRAISKGKTPLPVVLIFALLMIAVPWIAIAHGMTELKP